MLEETVLMSQDFINQMKQMATSFGGGEIEENKDASAYHNVDDSKKQALKMGEGVEYVSSKPLERDGKLGHFVIYSFKDITKIKVDENPADNMMSSSGMGKDKEAKADSQTASVYLAKARETRPDLVRLAGPN